MLNGLNWPVIRQYLRYSVLQLLDCLVLSCSLYLALWIRLDDPLIGQYETVFWQSLTWIVPIYLFVFHLVGIYRQVLKYANITTIFQILKGVTIGVFISVAIGASISDLPLFPRSVPIIFFLLSFVSIGSIRFSRRFYDSVRAHFKQKKGKGKALIFGAGGAGDLLIRHVNSNLDFPYRIIGFIDDNINKRGRLIHGRRIFGTRNVLSQVCKKNDISSIIIAIAAIKPEVLREVIDFCVANSIKPLVMPGIESILESGGLKLRPVQLNDLLRRSPKSVDHDKLKDFFGDNCILITGAGGSIGGEICRQIVRHGKPNKVLLLERSEYNLYKINEELVGINQGSSIIPVLGCAADDVLVGNLFNKHRPKIVLHAAAYKHVPLVEANPSVGIFNNIKSTITLANAAIEYGTASFVLISSDKAVNPTNVMGASKRACELSILSKSHQQEDCRFSAVRFGNVLGSSGSVIPKFLDQIQKDGPLTVTHPDITRYFMLVEEAVALVLQCAVESKGGEIFVLNMGTPVKIADMAIKLAALAGKSVGKDIDIEYTGLRPGEKMHEELLLDGEEIPTQCGDIFIVRQQRIDSFRIDTEVEKILQLAECEDIGCKKNLFEMIENSQSLVDFKKSQKEIPVETKVETAMF